MGFFFEEIFHFAKTTEFSLKGGWGAVIVMEIHKVDNRQKDTQMRPGTTKRTSTLVQNKTGDCSLWRETAPKTADTLFLILYFMENLSEHKILL